MSKLLAQMEAEEKKLQSVYDDISSHRISSASSTLQRYLKKNPTSRPALILRMYVMQKTNSTEEEILELYDKQIKGGEMTGRGVWWVGLVFRNLGRTDLALELYNDLSSKHPDSPELLEQVFLHAAAAQNIDVLTKSSRKLYSLTRDEKWARLSAWSEWVKNAPQPTPSQPFPAPCDTPISLKIAVLLLNSSKALSTSETVWLKAQILFSAGQLEEALKYLQEEGKEGGLVRLWWRMEGIKEILKRQEGQGKDTKDAWRFEEDWVEGLLRGDRDSQRNYAYYRHLLISTENLISDPTLIKSTDELLINLEKEIGIKERSPSLARLELQSILRKDKAESEISLYNEQWLKLVEQYWIKWGSKGSIITELEGIVGSDDEERKESLRDLMEKQAGQPHSDEQSFREQVNAKIYLLRDKPSEWEPTLDDIKKHWDLYLSGVQYGKNLPKTDTRPADQIGLTTISLLLELWSTDKSTKQDLLYKAILCLEKLIRDSPACAHGHYLLIRLYRLIGTPSLIAPHLSALKLSEIQLDNLLHVFTEQGAGEGILGNNQELWSEHMKKSGDMYQRTSVDFPEYVKECLSNETYSKIPSIRYIYSSLSKSITNHSRTIEQARLATYISAPYGTKLLKKLELALKDDSPVDLRNWELISEIGGNRPLIREITSIGSDGGVDGDWIKAFAGLYRSLGNFVNGDEAVEAEQCEASVEGLLPHEAALVKNVDNLIQSASKAINSTDDAVDIDIKAIFAESIQSTSHSQSRWTQIQSLICLYELIKIYEIILNKTTEPNKSLKGKNKSPVLTQFVSDLKAYKEESLKTVLETISEKLEGLSKVEVDWIKVNENWIEDKEFVGSQSKTIDNARKQALENLRGLFKEIEKSFASGNANANGNANGNAGGKNSKSNGKRR